MSKVPDTVRTELAAWAAKPERKIVFSDLPSTAAKDWHNAKRGRFYLPLKPKCGN